MENAMERNRYYKYVLALGHGCSDINQGALSAVLPFIIAAYHYDYTTAAMLVTVSNLFGSIVQPIFGTIADRKNKPWIMALGVLLAGGGMAFTGLTSNFYGLCAAVIVSGIGIAMFHPQAAQLVGRSSETGKQGKGISIFSFGGKIGSTLGPVLTSSSILLFGMKGTLAFLIPSVLFGIISAFFLKDFKELGEKEKADNGKSRAKSEDGPAASQDNWPAFIKLCITVFGRSIITNGMSTFLALYFIQILHQSQSFGNSALSVYFAIGALAALLGGSIADRFGYAKMIAVSFAVFFPSLILFTTTRNFLFAGAMLIPMAAAESLSYSPMVVLGQRYLPNHTGFASGITLGLAVSVGAVLCPVLGYAADRYGLTAALYVIAGVSAAALASSLFLPETVPEARE